MTASLARVVRLAISASAVVEATLGCNQPRQDSGRRLTACKGPAGQRPGLRRRYHGDHGRNGGTMRLWGGRFGEENDARVADFTRSIEVDAELALDDLRGSVAHVRGLGRAGILTDDEVAMLVEGLDGADARRRGGHGRVGPEPRGRPHERRGGARRAGRAGRGEAPHRPLAQRPGRDGPAALAATRDRPARRGAPRHGAGARRAGGAGRRGDPARDDAHPAGPAGVPRPPPAGVRRDARARPIPPGRHPAPGERQPAGIGRPRRRRLSPGPRGRRPPSLASTA